MYTNRDLTAYSTQKLHTVNLFMLVFNSKRLNAAKLEVFHSSTHSDWASKLVQHSGRPTTLWTHKYFHTSKRSWGIKSFKVPVWPRETYC